MDFPEFLLVILNAFVALGVIIDPLGTAAIYTAMIVGMPKDEQNAIARTATLVATSVLMFFGIAGGLLLSALGISMSAFKIAGGLLLFVIAFRMLMGGHGQSNPGNKGSAIDRSQIAVFPLAIPLLAGPGSITAMMLLVSEQKSLANDLAVYLGLLAAQIVTLICLQLSGRISQFLGKNGMVVLNSLIGILLAAMSVQFIIDGLSPIIKSLFLS